MAVTMGGMDASQQSAMRAALSEERAALQAQLEHHYKAIRQVLEHGCKAIEERILQQDASVTNGRGNLSNHEDQMSPPTSNVFSNKDQTSPQESLPGAGISQATESPPEPQEAGQVLDNRSLTSSDMLNAKVKSTHKSIVQLMGGKNDVIDRGTWRGRLDRLFQGPFEHFFCGLIIANCLMTCVETQELGERANESLGLKHNHWPHAADVFDATEVFFTLAFVLEFSLRIFTYRLAFVKDWHNVAEGCCVVLMALEILLSSFMEGFIIDGSVLRVLRIVRLMRAFRIVRVVGRFRELRLLLNTIVASFMAVLWSMVLMFIVHLILALTLCKTLHDYIVDDSNPPQQREWMNRMYGNGLKSLWTVFQMTFSGGWPNWAVPVVEHVSPWYAAVFIVYVVCIIFTMTRIISALFLKETMVIASLDAESMVREKIKDTANFRTKLHAMFMAADVSGDGRLTEDELNEFLGHEEVKVLFGKLGVDASDSRLLFKLLDTGNGCISRTAFMQGIQRLKGEAKSMDLIPLVSTCHQILDHCVALRTATLRPPVDLVPTTYTARVPIIPPPQCAPWSWMTARGHRVSQHVMHESALLQ